MWARAHTPQLAVSSAISTWSKAGNVTSLQILVKDSSKKKTKSESLKSIGMNPKNNINMKNKMCKSIFKE